MSHGMSGWHKMYICDRSLRQSLAAPKELLPGADDKCADPYLGLLLHHLPLVGQQAKAAGVADHVLWTGWLPMGEGWRYVRAAEVGLSPFPRGFLLDSASPTKVPEYLALFEDKLHTVLHAARAIVAVRAPPEPEMDENGRPKTPPPENF